MKNKSTSKLAFLSLRVLPGLVAAASMALALAPYHAVGDTSTFGGPASTPTCYPSGTPPTADWPSSDPDILLPTDFYFAPFLPLKPVLVFRGCEQRCTVGRNISYLWPPNSAYHLLAQDMREDCGSNDDLLFKFDQADGHKLIELIDAQTWSQGPTGHIAMEGWSNAGILSYVAAVNAHPSLRGIQPHFATGDLLNYGLFNGGVLHRETADLLGYPEGTSWEDYVGMAIWDNYLITDSQAALATVAGFHVGGWFDVFGQGTLDSFSRLQKAGNPTWRNRQKVVIGPWLHGGNGTTPVGDGYLTFPSATDTRAVEYNSKWQNGVFHDNAWTDWINLPAVRVYHTGASQGTEWRTYTTWPPPGIEYPLYFASGGSLSSGDPPPRIGGSVAFMSNPLDPCPTLGGTNNIISCVPDLRPDGTCGPYDQRPIEQNRTDLVKFTSGTSGATIVGRIHADVWIQTNLPDVDVFVRMTNVFPDGHSMLMAQGIQRARYRNGVCPQPLDLTPPTLVRVDMSSTALVVPVGNRVRVIVSAQAGPSFGSSQYPLYSVNPQNGDEYLGGFGHQPRTGSITVLFGGTHASAIYIPVPTGQTPPPDRRPNTTPCPQ